MGVSKRGPVIEERDRLLLEFADGNICMSDGQKLSYTTRIHLVCSRRTIVSESRAELSFFNAEHSLSFSAVTVCVFAPFAVQSMGPRFLTNQNCTANFIWETSAACAIRTTKNNVSFTDVNADRVFYLVKCLNIFLCLRAVLWSTPTLDLSTTCSFWLLRVDTTQAAMARTSWYDRYSDNM